MPAAAYHLRLTDRGPVKGVPVVDVYLVRTDGEAEFAAMHSCGLSPATAEELAQAFGELGVRVERESRPVEVGPEPKKKGKVKS